MNKRSFHNAEPAGGKGLTNTWYTPKSIIENLGVFDLDPCTNSTRPFNTAQNHFEHDLGADGLSLKWSGRVWRNPPYGKFTNTWLNKMLDHKNGIALVFSRCETRWAQEHIHKADAVNFLDKRISFIRDNGERGGVAACGSMLLAYGENNKKYLKNIGGLYIEKDSIIKIGP